MTTRNRTPWGQTTAGVIVVNGVLTAVVSALVTWTINNATSLPWSLFALTFAIVAIGVFLILSLFRARLRETIWKRPFRWARGLRITTADQRRAAIEHAESKALASANSATKALVATSEQRVDDATRASTTLLRENAKLSLELHEKSEKMRAMESSSQNAQGKILPRPLPRWSLVSGTASWSQERGQAEVVLRNAIPDSVALGVRIDALAGAEVTDAGYWKDLSGVTGGSFRIALDSTGISHGSTYEVRWSNSDGEDLSEPLILRAIDASPTDGSPF